MNVTSAQDVHVYPKHVLVHIWLCSLCSLCLEDAGPGKYRIDSVQNLTLSLLNYNKLRVHKLLKLQHPNDMMMQDGYNQDHHVVNYVHVYLRRMESLLMGAEEKVQQQQTMRDDVDNIMQGLRRLISVHHAYLIDIV